MLKTIFSLMPIQMKLGIGVAAALAIATGIGVIKVQASSIDKLENKIAVCDTERVYEKAIYTSELDKAYMIISDQNKQIEEFKINAKQYETDLSLITKELETAKQTKRVEIRKEVVRDPSCDNQLRLMQQQLEEFANAFN